MYENICIPVLVIVVEIFQMLLRTHTTMISSLGKVPQNLPLNLVACVSGKLMKIMIDGCNSPVLKRFAKQSRVVQLVGTKKDVFYRPGVSKRFLVSSVSIVSGYGLDDRAIGVRFPAGAKDSSSNLCVQTGSGVHPTSFPMGTGGPFPWGKARPGRDADHSPSPSAEVVNE
jgi:hypothetical protein